MDFISLSPNQAPSAHEEELGRHQQSPKQIFDLLRAGIGAQRFKDCCTFCIRRVAAERELEQILNQ